MIEDIKNAISMLNKTQTHAIEEISFSDALNSILIAVTPKCLPIIKARFGYDDGKYRTLEEIGNAKGLTRERIRQIIAKEIRRIKHYKTRKALEAIIENIERLLFQYNGILSINDIAKDSYFISGTYEHIRFLTNLIIELYEDRYRIIEKNFFTSLNDNEIKERNSTIHEAALRCQFPTNKERFFQEITTVIGPISKDYLFYFLIQKKRAEISKENILSPGRLSIVQRIKFLLRDVNEPLHFTEIGKLYKSHFGELTTHASEHERLIHAKLDYSKDFIIVGPGTFMLRDKFKTPDNIRTIVEMSKEILQRLKTISDTKYLIKELQSRGANVENLNEYSLKHVLLEYPGFVGYRKFEIGIDELADKYERKSLSDLIYEVLSSTDKPLHAKEIWRQISKQRGFPRYAIDQRLYNEPQFIKMAPSTYTVKENIPSYEKKYKLIVDFVKEWISLKGHAVSAFFVNEVLKATEEIKDLNIGLVEHVLATSQEFTKLPNGFYDLAEKRHEHRN
jgi:DNA-directed RNA polymerase delta subunit